MENQNVQEVAAKYGYTVREESYGHFVEKGRTSYCVSHEDEKFSYLQLSLHGPVPHDEMIPSLIQLFEEDAKTQGKPFSFRTNLFHYDHPGYYNLASYHTKTPAVKATPLLFELFQLVYDWCVEEEKRDRLFEWDFNNNKKEFLLSIVKMGYEKRFKFYVIKNELHFRIDSYLEPKLVETFQTAQACFQRVIAYVDELYRKNRLTSVCGELPMIYTKRALYEVGIKNEQAETLITDFCSRIEPEEVEYQCKHLYESQILRIENEVTKGISLLRLLDRWVVKTGVDVLSFEHVLFDDALQAYQQALFNEVVNKENQQIIEQIKTSL